MEGNFTNEEKQLLDSSVEFMEKCDKGILINPGPFVCSETPKISIIIPVYNASATIKKAIRSIQNQNLQDIEIILLDDCSPDNSYDIMQELQKEDPRIKLSKNEQNRGVLYTRLTASLTAKGKYIMYLDNDDMFSRHDIFTILYNEIEEGNYDVVEFNGYSTHDYHLINKKKNIASTSHLLKPGGVYTQPELSKILLRRVNDEKVELGNTFLWGKIVRADVMKKSIEIFGKENYEQKVLLHDDDCVICILFQNAKSLKFLNIYGIYYYTNQESITHYKRPFQICHDILFFFDFLDKYYAQDKKEDIAIRLLNEWDERMAEGLNEENINYAKQIIDKLMGNNSIKEEIKEKIRQKCKL